MQINVLCYFISLTKKIIVLGKPSPTIKWWRGERLVDSVETRSGFENVRKNQLIVRGLQRSDQHAVFTCQAANNNISQPVSATTAVEIFCKYNFKEFLCFPARLPLHFRE